jgi:hypothetical protein
MSNARNLARLLPNASGQLPDAAMSSGSVLQVVQAVFTGDLTTTSTSYVDVSGLIASITPSSSSSKILVRVCLNNLSISDANLVMFNLLRGSTTLTANTSGGVAASNSAWATGGGGGLSNNERKISSGIIDYIDSPSSATQQTYKVQMKVSGGTGTLNRWQLNTDNASVSSITLMEIAA